MTEFPFTARLMKWLLIFLVGLGASYLAVSTRALLLKNIRRPALWLVVIDLLHGLLSIGVLVLTIIAGVIVFTHILRAYEIGAKDLNGTHNIERKPPK